MPEFHWRLPALISRFDDATLLARPLLLDVSCLGLRGNQLKERLARRVAEAIRQIPPGDMHRFLLSDLPEARTIELELPPLRDDILRPSPVSLSLQYVVWRHGGDALIAYVPALSIEVLAEDERQLAELLAPQIKLALSRARLTQSLRHLTQLGRYAELSVRPLPVKVKLPTLKEAALEQKSREEKQGSLLKKIASNLAVEPSRPVYEREAELQRLAELLTRRNPRSVLLIGRSGVGKTALVQQLGRRRYDFELGQTPLWSTSGSRIIAGQTGFGMWQERCENIVREAAKTKALLHLGNLIELIEVGKGGGNLQGVAAMLRPHLDRGAFLAIVECTPEQLAIIEREDPQLLETFAHFELAPSTPDQTLAILRSVASEQGNRSRLPAESLATLDRLHRRWATYSASPGRQLRFLRNLLDDHRRGPEVEITAADVTAAFSHETGLPLFMLNDAISLDLAATHGWFTQRVIGQIDAVQHVVELLAAVKAGLARGGKPIASLLFMGPTGVGKTEMAKSLAEFLFQDRGRMIRFDMSEYSHPAAIERLIDGASSGQGLLTQKVRDQPFTVVLFDEFEKAHPQFFDVLLQVLGEGRLTDGAGRVTDLTNSVVIMTSNIGAELYRRGGGGFAGEGTADFAEPLFEREVKAFLRPEMFNRLDRIVPFLPLDRATIAAIARRELNQILAREGLRFRDIDLELDDEILEHLAEGGFDPRYGARPLKRAIERQFVAPLAAGLNRYTGEMPLSCQTVLSDAQLRVKVDARPEKSIRNPDTSATSALELVVGLRRHVQALQQSSLLTRVRNEIDRIRQAQQARERRFKRQRLPMKYDFTPQQARLLGHEGLLERVDRLAGEVIALEDDSLQRFYADQALDTASLELHRSELDRAFRQLLFDLPRVEDSPGRLLTIAAFGESLPEIVELMTIYQSVIRRCGEDARWYWLKMYREEFDESLGGAARPRVGPRPNTRLLSRPEPDHEDQQKVIDVFNTAHNSLDQIPADCIGIAAQLSGPKSVALLQTESGRHEFVRADGERLVCLVETVADRLVKYEPPLNVGRRGSFSDLRFRRVYNHREEQVRDELLERYIPIRGRRMEEAVNRALEEYLAARLWELIEAWS